MAQIGLLLGLLPMASLHAQLPFDPAQIDQLTPEQRQRALETLGTSGGVPTQSQSDGKFRDQKLTDPADLEPSRRPRPRDRRDDSFAYDDGCDDSYDPRGDLMSGGSYDTRSDSRTDPGLDAGYDRSDNSRTRELGAAAGVAGEQLDPRDDLRSDPRGDRRYDDGSYDDSRYSDTSRADTSRADDSRYGDRRSSSLDDQRNSRSSRSQRCRDSSALPRQRNDNRFTDDPRRLRPFGYDLFLTRATTFAPVTNIPVPADYVLGPGDNVHVQLFGNENGNYSLQVARDGHINFPKLGPISVAGQRFEDVKQLLSERITRELIGVQSSISLGDLRSVRVFLLGDVNQPGSYTVSSLSTITNALFVGGGVGKLGSLRNIQLKRDGRVIKTLDLYALLLNGDSSADLRVQPGDAIFVPPVGARVSIDGPVKRPAIYELKGEKTVGEILSLAGGLQASSNTSTAQIERYDGNRKTIKQVDVANAADLRVRIQDGDFLHVAAIAGRLDNNVRVIGYVKYPGAFQWSDGYELKALLEAAQIQPSDTSKEAYLPLGLIERTNAQSGVRGWLSFNVQQALAADAPSFPLQRDDLILILNREDVAYLDSKEVRAIAAGDFRAAKECPPLETLVPLVNSARATRFLKAFTAETTRTGVASKQRSGRTLCPEVFRQAPRALPYLLEEAVAIYGEVRRPGLYPIAPGIPLNVLVEAAGGLSNEADPANIEYISYDEALQAGHSSYRTLDLKQADIGALRVSPGDVFNFKPLYLGQEVGTVRLLGEVRFPGSYGILRGEHLTELYRRAGGLTSNAYPFGAVFTRYSARLAEQESFQRAASDLQEALVTAVTSGALGRDAQVSGQFLNTVVQRLQEAKAVGRVVVEADPKVLAARPDSDPLLEPGDALVMPKRPISVTIIGQVLNPGSQAFTPGAGLKQYVERAGGYAQAADEGRVFVILPNGTAQKFRSSFWSFRAQDVPPGSLIVVPRDAAPFNLIAFSERVFGVLSNLALSAAALSTISRGR